MEAGPPPNGYQALIARIDELGRRLTEVERIGSPAHQVLVERVQGVRDDLQEIRSELREGLADVRMDCRKNVAALREELLGKEGAIPAVREENRWLRRSLLLSLAFPLAIGLAFILAERAGLGG